MDEPDLTVDSAAAETAVAQAAGAVASLNGGKPGKYLLNVYIEVSEADGYAYSWNWRYFPPDWIKPRGEDHGPADQGEPLSAPDAEQGADTAAEQAEPA